MIHDLKTWPPYFRDIMSKIKTFEIRENNRDFKAGDTLRLNEWSPKSKSYTGKTCNCLVIYIIRGPHFGIEEKYCVMGIALITNPPRKEKK